MESTNNQSVPVEVTYVPITPTSSPSMSLDQQTIQDTFNDNEFLIYFISNISYDIESPVPVQDDGINYRERFLTMFEPLTSYTTFNIHSTFPMFSNVSDIFKEIAIAEIERLTTNENVECEICFKNKPLKTTLTCNHSYCKECITEWVNRSKNTCPMCRKKIMTSQ